MAYKKNLVHEMSLLCIRESFYKKIFIYSSPILFFTIIGYIIKGEFILTIENWNKTNTTVFNKEIGVIIIIILFFYILYDLVDTIARKSILIRIDGDIIIVKEKHSFSIDDVSIRDSKITGINNNIVKLALMSVKNFYFSLIFVQNSKEECNLFFEKIGITEKLH